MFTSYRYQLLHTVYVKETSSSTKGYVIMIPGWKARCFTLTLFLIVELSLALLSPTSIASAPATLPQSHSISTEDMSADPPFILSQEKVSQAVDLICSREKSETTYRLRDHYNLAVEIIKDWDPILPHVAAKASIHDTYLENRTPWHFGISIRTADEGGKVIGFVTFYVAYSSWSGRILYLDQIQLEDGRMNDDVEMILLRLLADIALELDCARLTWRVRKGA